MTHPFNLTKAVFDQVYGNSRTEANDLAIAEKIAAFRAEYHHIGGGVDYTHPLWRIAYLYSYVGGHASFLEEILTKFHSQHGPIFRTNSTNVACIGGGPGTDAIGIQSYLENHPAPNQSQLNCCVYDKEQGWDQLWTTVAQNIGANAQFQALDVCIPTSPVTLQALGTFDLITVSYLVSEVAQYPAAGTFFQNLFAAARPDATIVYVDNSGMHTNAFDGYCQNSGWAVVMRNDADIWEPSRVNVEARIFRPDQNCFLQVAKQAGKVPNEGFNPKSSAKLGYRILRRT